jgi:hypothetical protein
MWRDPIVTEIRRLREEFAASFDYGINAICRAAREKQAKSGHKNVSHRPRLVKNVDSNSNPAV